jgi:hypothetical protein
MQYLVLASEGPKFTSAEQALPVLQKMVLPGLEALAELETKKTILAGGLPVGARALAFIIEATSHDELDALLEKIPLWPLLAWQVTPLQSFKKRADHERTAVAQAKR